MIDRRAGATARGTMIAALARWLEAPLVIGDSVIGEPRDAIVVLGASLGRRDSLSPVLAERVTAAIQLWRAGAAPTIVCTGGITGRAHRAEATVMAAALVGAGVPPAAIVVEDAALNTADNARYVAALLPAGARVWIVTQPFHARRAVYLFRRAGLDPTAWHIADSLEYRDRRRALRWLVREYAAWLRVVVRRR
jgi:SanA protein